MQVQRYDRTRIGSSVRVNGAGGLRAPAKIARVGVQQYGNGKDSWGELRLPEEVFDVDSLASLRDVPVTIAHEGGMISPSNWKDYAHGHVAGHPRSKDGWVCADLVVSSGPAVEGVQRRELVELSAGYGCRLEAKEGIYQGQPYSYVQREIRYNHCSLLPPGHARAGSEARLRLDSSLSVASSVHFYQGSPVKTLRFDTKNATATLGDQSYKLDSKEDRLAFVRALHAAGSVAYHADMDPAAVKSMVEDLMALNAAQAEGIAMLMEALAAEPAPGDETLTAEEVEELVGVEAMDSAVIARAEVVGKAQALGLETKDVSTPALKKEILRARGYQRLDSMDKSMIETIFSALPAETFDSQTREIVRSGSAGKEDKTVAAKAAAKARRANAWRPKS